MATHVNQGDSIECRRSVVAVRKVSGPTFITMKGIDQNDYEFFKYKSKIRAIVRIVESLDPKECIISESSFLDVDDRLEGDVVEIYATIQFDFQKISNFSHVHGIQGDSLNSFTYAKIVQPWRFVTQRAIKN
jgi:hypothetical protein